MSIKSEKLFSSFKPRRTCSEGNVPVKIILEDLDLSEFSFRTVNMKNQAYHTCPTSGSRSASGDPDGQSSSSMYNSSSSSESIHQARLPLHVPFDLP